MKKVLTVILSTTALFHASAASADSFGGGANNFDIQFVHVGNPGNAADTTGTPNPAGSVPNAYRIAKYEISEDMINKANALGSLGLTHSNRGANKPADSISWFEAAKFVNWLNTSVGSNPAYKFDGGGALQLWDPADAGYNPNNLFRNSFARYFLPSADEWYKAAYYDPTAGLYFDYPTGSDSAPVSISSGVAGGTAVYNQAFATGPADVTLAGGLSPYGTMGQGGNVWEWEEPNLSLGAGQSILRGSGWFGGSAELRSTIQSPGNQNLVSEGNGFRVASVPEPTAIHLVLFVAMALLQKKSAQSVPARS